ncbi:MAG: hypothetical protein RDV48_00990 [Candidatus Eremiobacteraeota bacterium]|nr:hypothetical protein [Candidatus Eremiobacteraeota bacterium]
MVVRFSPASKAVGTFLKAGTWYAYPNLPPNVNTAAVTVIISTPSGGTQGEDTRSSAGGR